MYLIKLNLTVSLTCTFFGFCFSLNQPAGLAKKVADRLAFSPAAEVMLNGTESDDTSHKDLTTGNNKTVLLLNENGTSDTEPPHGSVTGSNGFILTKQQQPETNWLPSGSPTGGHAAKTLPASASGSAQSSGALRTAPSTGTKPGQGTPDTKNGPSLSPSPVPAPVTVHRARKTMSRPAVSPAQKVNHDQEQGIIMFALDLFFFNTLRNKNTSPAPVPPPQPPPAPAERAKKRRMGMYSLVPKKKTKVLKQRTVLEMFKELQQTAKSPESTESSLKKKLKKKTKADSAWLRPSRKRKRRMKSKGDRCSSIYTSGLAVEEAQELPLCSCRMETPKSREILILADRKCMATESVDGQLTRCTFVFSLFIYSVHCLQSKHFALS
uniref:Uncharacterized protein n=1 Tax=Pundamilia nyererei TaxID=303518 RepID=A0A3B4GM37_9CICH